MLFHRSEVNAIIIYKVLTHDSVATLLAKIRFFRGYILSSFLLFMPIKLRFFSINISWVSSYDFTVLTGGEMMIILFIVNKTVI